MELKLGHKLAKWGVAKEWGAENLSSGFIWAQMTCMGMDWSSPSSQARRGEHLGEVLLPFIV